MKKLVTATFILESNDEDSRPTCLKEWNRLLVKIEAAIGWFKVNAINFIGQPTVYEQPHDQMTFSINAVFNGDRYEFDNIVTLWQEQFDGSWEYYGDGNGILVTVENVKEDTYDDTELCCGVF